MQDIGMGFVLTPEEAEAWIAADPRNADVLFPYLNGEDLNSRPDASAPRWVIDFNDRSEVQAKVSTAISASAQTVRPERMKNNRKARRERWWQFCEWRPPCGRRSLIWKRCSPSRRSARL